MKGKPGIGWVAAIAFVLATSASVGPASAQEPATAGSAGGLMSRPFYVGLGVGGVFNLEGVGSAFRLEEDVGYRVWSFGDHPGLFVGGLFNQAFRSGWTGIDLDARIGVDFNVYDWGSGALIITPGLATGVTLLVAKTTVVDPWTGGTTSSTSTTALFNMIFTGQIGVALVDGLLLIWFRPIGIEVLAKDGATANWDLNAGVLFNF
ncbi:MAG: hypothetical protein HY907_18905 [Deltaproteobacteria bacterium]|nr:hypothetical protein [Deltaproteobacteria bacterium]